MATLRCSGSRAGCHQAKSTGPLGDDDNNDDENIDKEPVIVVLLAGLIGASSRLLDAGLLEQTVIGHLVGHSVTCFSGALRYASS